MIVAEWRPDVPFKYNANAQTVAEEIISIGDSATPAQIVEVARNENTELHKCFEWDDSIAAEKYRKHQAGDIVRCLVIKRTEDTPKETPPLRFFYKPSNGEGYKPTAFIVKHEDEYQKLLERALSELRAFKAKYSMLQELEEIFALIN